MPLEAMLHMGYMMAMQGKVPVFDDAGKPTGQTTPLETGDRVKIWGKLLDKAMPNQPVEEKNLGHELPDAKEVEAIAHDEERLRELDNETLREVAGLEYKDAETESPWG